MPVILVVDDNRAVRGMVETILRMAGFSVMGAGCASEALHVCSREGQQIDLVVADALMPEMSGTEMVREMRSRGINIPVLHISGESNATAARRTVAAETV